MHPVLQEVYQSYARALADKPAEWCRLHPGGDHRHWSAQDLVEHLVLVCRSTCGVLETRLERGRPTRARRTLSQRMLQMVILSFGHMPRGAPAPPFARPGQISWPPMNGNQLFEILRQEMDQMDHLLEVCRQRFGIEPAATHFRLGPMRADQWRRFHAIHFRHHLEQLHRIGKSVGPPEPVSEQAMHAQP
jgi:hypothetical protein